MSEYEILRAEMMENYTEINNCRSVLYAAVATILTFAVQSDNYLMCLIPYLVIVPLFFLCESKHSKICWIGAYLYVYLEGDNFNWENRHHKYDARYPKDSKREWQATLMYYIVSSTCSALSIYKIFCSEFTVFGQWVRAIIVFVLTLTIIIIMKKTTVQYVITRGAMIKQWKRLKDKE